MMSLRAPRVCSGYGQRVGRLRSVPCFVGGFSGDGDVKGLRLF